MAQGCGHEEEFDPLAALFEVFEELEFVHVAPVWGGLFATPAPKEKARPVGRASFFLVFTLYFQYSILKWVIVSGLQDYIVIAVSNLGAIV